jgi:hypothetical protein
VAFRDWVSDSCEVEDWARLADGWQKLAEVERLLAEAERRRANYYRLLYFLMWAMAVTMGVFLVVEKWTR